MKTFIASRLAATVAILVALTAVMFVLQHISPLDPVKAQMGAQSSASAVAACPPPPTSALAPGSSWDAGVAGTTRWKWQSPEAMRSRMAAHSCPSDSPSTTSVNNSYINITPGWAFPLYNYACNFGNGNYLQAAVNGVPFLGAPFGDLHPSTDSGTTQGPSGTFGFRDIIDGTSGTMLVSEVVQGQTSSTSTASGDIRGLTVWSVGVPEPASSR